MENERFSKGPYIAVATSDGLQIDTHLGKTTRLAIFSWENGKIRLLENRDITPAGLSPNRWDTLAGLLTDCSVILASRIGRQPLNSLREKGFTVEAVEGEINLIVKSVFKKHTIPAEHIRLAGVCNSGQGCTN